MAERRAEEETPAISPSNSGELPVDSGQDPEIFGREKEEGEKEKDTEGGREAGKGEEAEEATEAETEGFRPSKRRKKCPAALEKSLSSNRGFSFSFDTKVAANGPIESTPKFGSFNHSDGVGSGGASAFQEEEEEEGKKVEGGGEEVESGAEKGA